MSPWELLGIEKQTIKTYKEGICSSVENYHPEDNPDGFMALRQAYEAALKEADEAGIPHRIKQIDNNTFIFAPSDFIEINEDDYIQVHNKENNESFCGYNSKNTFSKINELYEDFFKRIDPDKWKSLILEFSIPEYDVLCTYMCHFLNEHYVLPLEVWQYLNKEFNLEENVDFRWHNLLYYDYGLKYDIFDEGYRYDYGRYAELRLQGLLEFMNSCYETAVDILNEAEKLYSNDGTLFRIRGYAGYMLNCYNEALEDFNKALAIKSNDVDALLAKGNVLLKLKHYEEAGEIFKATQKIMPKSRRAAIGRIKALHGKGMKTAAGFMYRSFKKKSKTSDLELEVFYFQRAKEILQLIKKYKYFVLCFIMLAIVVGPAIIYSIVYCFVHIPLFRYIVISLIIWRVIRWYRRKKEEEKKY